jgi:hypothetical protein
VYAVPSASILDQDLAGYVLVALVSGVVGVLIASRIPGPHQRAWFAAVGVALGAVIVDPLIGPAKTRDLPEVPLLVLLGLIALTVPAVRTALRRLQTVKAGAFELVLAEHAEAVLEQLRSIEAEEGDPDRALRIIGSDDLERASDSFGALRRKLKENVERLNSTLRLELRSDSLLDRLDTLGDRGLLNPDQTAVLKAVTTLTRSEVAAWRANRPDDLRSILRAGDRLVNTLGATLLVSLVRQAADPGCWRIFDWTPQPKDRRPDFVLHLVPNRKAQCLSAGATSIWVSARSPSGLKGEIWPRVTKRLRKSERRVEVPGGTEMPAVIVVPLGNPVLEKARARTVSKEGEPYVAVMDIASFTELLRARTSVREHVEAAPQPPIPPVREQQDV